MEDSFSTDGGGGGDRVGGEGFGMIQPHYLSCALYFYYCDIASTSGQQALDPRGGGPLL